MKIEFSASDLLSIRSNVRAYNGGKRTIGRIVNANPLNGGGSFCVSGEIPESLTVERIGTTGKTFRLLDIAFRVANRATRETNGNLWFDDCLQVAIMGLLWAIDNFTEARGVKIQTLGYHSASQHVRTFLRSVRKTDPTYLCGNGNLTARQMLTNASQPSDKRMAKLIAIGSKIIYLWNVGPLSKKQIVKLLELESSLRRLLAFQAKNEILYNPDTVELRELRSFGIESLDSVVPRGRWVCIRLASHQPILGDDDFGAVEPEDTTQDEQRHESEVKEEFEQFKLEHLNVVEREWLERHLNGEAWTSIARKQHLNPNAGRRMGIKIMERVERFWISRTR